MTHAYLNVYYIPYNTFVLVHWRFLLYLLQSIENLCVYISIYIYTILSLQLVAPTMDLM